MGYVIAMRPPTGPVEYYPKGFGFTSHAHTLNRAEAEVFPTQEAAQKRSNAYRFPPYFWESERRHRQRMEEKFKRWAFTVESVEEAQG